MGGGGGEAGGVGDAGVTEQNLIARVDGKDYSQFMVSDVRKLIENRPFIPFKIHLADGGELRVPTVDHVAISPSGGRVIVFGDDDGASIVSPLLISRITVEQQAALEQKK